MLNPFDQHGQIVDRHAQNILEKGPTGEQRSECADKLAFALVDEGVDQRVAILANHILIGGDHLGTHVRVELMPPAGVDWWIGFFRHQIGQSIGPVWHIALGAAERPPILGDAPYLFVGIDEMIAGADVAVRDRAFVDHEVEYVVEPVVEHRIVKIKVTRNIPAEPGLQRLGGDFGIGLHLGTGVIHG